MHNRLVDTLFSLASIKRIYGKELQNLLYFIPEKIILFTVNAVQSTETKFNFFLGKEAVNKSIRNELNLLVPVLKKAISVAFLSSGT